MLSAYFRVNHVQEQTLKTPRTKTLKTKTPKAAKAVEPYDGGGCSMARFTDTHRTAAPAPVKPEGPRESCQASHGSQASQASDDDGDAVLEEHEYEYLMREALKAEEAGTDAEDDDDLSLPDSTPDSTCSLASSPEKEFIANRRRGPRASEVPVYAGPEFWHDDADYSDDYDG